MPVADFVSQKFEYFHIPISKCFCHILTAINPDSSHTLCTITAKETKAEKIDIITEQSGIQPYQKKVQKVKPPEKTGPGQAKHTNPPGLGSALTALCLDAAGDLVSENTSNLDNTKGKAPKNAPVTSNPSEKYNNASLVKLIALHLFYMPEFH
ncbi:uncharacterized protein K444DRAFT_627371 [Hyaloscypha bicolor E]|uniref:Uncharacterized protein n=1 Tax=Hyaloscypha bicolor E TaxID=1095630 RepID=A0A2J6THJ6_9HELO|nr:uncharacterized protein K444DRAFT_627371 [Hyaloscypha bicolor E]PMD62438.1 hypothetical protein K444DRAFT_627371 [Hyaloscypha bicolor E]